MADALRIHFCSTYFSEDSSVYHSESEHNGGNESDAATATLHRDVEKGSHLHPDDMPKQRFYGNASVSTTIKTGGDDRKNKSSAFTANIPRLAQATELRA